MKSLKNKYQTDKKVMKIGLINVALQFAFNKITSLTNKRMMNKFKETKKLLKI